MQTSNEYATGSEYVQIFGASYYYLFQDEDEVTTPGVLKVRIPKAGALVTKSQDGSAISLSRAESVDAKLKVPPQKRAPGGKKKDGAIPESQGVAVNVKEEEEDSKTDIDRKVPLTTLKFKFSNGKIIE